MPYSESLADRTRQALGARRGVTEKRMFGGLAFLLRGNMLAAVWQSALIVRLGAEQAAAALEQPHVGEFDVTGRPMKGWVMIEPDGLENDRELDRWIELAWEFVGQLPAK